MLLACGAKYSSSALATFSGFIPLLREAIISSGFDWRREGDTLANAMVNIIWKTGRAVSQPRAALASRSTAGKHASKFIVWTERCAPRTCLEEVKALEYVFGARSADSGKLPQDAPP
mmetsp:Transcript_29075/g.56195  ORF Transcript_29075/g.56195 Transcript_29075/m.56195 type:complete len:117 (+) Transcript_29075:1-351(+)